MKKIKKIFSVLLTLAMVLGMSMTTFAAPEATAKITVDKLTPNDKTTVKLYQVIRFNDANSTWEVTDWVKEALKEDDSLVDLNQKPAVIDYEKLYKNYLPATADDEKLNVNTSSVDFEGLEVGAYLITAAGENTSYNVMGAATYDYDESNHLIKPINAKVNAKGETYTVVKTLKNTDQTFVMKGDTVTFYIDTVFPSYASDRVDREFSITDTPTGMKITGVEVSVGGEPVAATNYTVEGLNQKNTPVTVHFNKEYIGMKNEHAAKAVRVTVTAVITSDDGKYSNEATSNYDSSPYKVEGHSGTLTIYKTTDEENKDKRKPLTGAKFSVKKDDKALEFVELEDGVYTLYTEDTVIPDGKVKVTDVTVGADGKVVLKGLGEGVYEITETLAPEGYSINANIPNATITKDSAENVQIDVPDSKLSALPGTGGIGTTIFTIGGCLIMIIAAALFFASRKKQQH